MPREDFEHLLESMPRIAEAVNSFNSEDVQRKAFDTLVHIYGLDTSPTQTSGARAPEPVEQEVPSVGVVDDTEISAGSEAYPGRKAKPSKKSPKRQWTADRGIDFWPQDGQSFQALVEEKKPTSIDQKNLLAVFWLEQIAELDEVGVGKVLAAYKATGWAEPSHPDTQLRNTASRNHWIDTSDMKSIKTTPGGRNMVNQQMPVIRAKKK